MPSLAAENAESRDARAFTRWDWIEARVAGGRGEGRYSVGCNDVNVEPNHCGFAGFVVEVSAAAAAAAAFGVEEERLARVDGGGGDDDDGGGGGDGDDDMSRTMVDDRGLQASVFCGSQTRRVRLLVLCLVRLTDHYLYYRVSSEYRPCRYDDGVLADSTTQFSQSRGKYPKHLLNPLENLQQIVRSLFCAIEYPRNPFLVR